MFRIDFGLFSSGAGGGGFQGQPRRVFECSVGCLLASLTSHDGNHRQETHLRLPRPTGDDGDDVDDDVPHGAELRRLCSLLCLT